MNFNSTVNAVLLKMGMKDKIETAVKVALSNGKTIALDKDPAKGAVVFLMEGETRLEIEDGEYILSGGPSIKVEGGVIVEEPTAPAEEAEMAAEPKATETKAAEPAVKDTAADVQMALVEKIIELSNKKSEKENKMTKEDIQAAVALELAKVPAVAPMAPAPVQSVELSRKELKLMSTQERAYNYVSTVGQKVGQPRAINLASGEPDIVTTYAGNFALPYVGAMLLSGPTLANGYVTIKQGVPLSGQVVKVMALGANMKAATCDFTHSGTIDLTEKILLPVDRQIQLEVCKNELLIDWEQDKMGAGRSNKSLPPGFSSYLLARVAAQHAGVIETNLWQGVAGTDTFEGFEAKLTTEVALATTAPTAANIVAKLRLVTGAIPTTQKFNPDFKLFCSATILQAYLESQRDAGIADLYNTADVAMRFDGYEMLYCPGITAGSVIGATKDNLWFGTDLMSDHSSARVLDMTPLDMSENVRIGMKFTVGTQIGILADCVHGTQTA